MVTRLPLSLFALGCSRSFTVKNILWILAVALFAGHELDAVAQAEWRLLYGLRALEPAQGRDWFIALHVPLCAALMLLAGHRQARIRRISRRSLAGFFVVHAGLHYRLQEHPLYLFGSLPSQVLIYACALAGFGYLLLDLGSRHDPTPVPTHH
ncbi:hypothetical protein I9018_11640 [Pseudomonas sp. MPFS]|nr:hypothetical protein I9018_11640 [Pseudomonas sp. MPFS]